MNKRQDKGTAYWRLTNNNNNDKKRSDRSKKTVSSVAFACLSLILITSVFVTAPYKIDIPKTYATTSLSSPNVSSPSSSSSSSSSNLSAPIPTPSFSLTPQASTSRFVYSYGDYICSFDPTLGCAVGIDGSSLVVQDKQTGQIYKVQPFRDGLPLCSDPAYVVGALGSSCYHDGDPPTPTPKPISPLPSTSPEPKSQ